MQVMQEQLPATHRDVGNADYAGALIGPAAETSPELALTQA